MGRRPGYEYHYRFWTDDSAVSDEILSIYSRHKIKTLFVFEMRSNFILKRRSDDDDDEMMGSETPQFCYVDFVNWYVLDCYLGYRLREYWMPDDEIEKLINGAVSFAEERAALPGARREIPVVVGMDVWMVQQEGELYSSAVDRAIRPEFLFPLELWPDFDAVKPRRDVSVTRKMFLFFLEKIRVEDVEEGLGVMELCPICLCSPTIGDQISLVPQCHHAFHNHCLVRWLSYGTICPMCRTQVHMR